MKVLDFFKKEMMLTVSLIACIISLFITPPDASLLKAIDWKTLCTLFMLLTVLEGFKKESIFNPIINKTSNIKHVLCLSFFFVFAVFFTSMFVTNDVSLIIFVPLTIILYRNGNKEHYILPLLALENIAAIRGSLLTPFGSPQNLYLYSSSGISTPEFIKIMSPLWFSSMILLSIFIVVLHHKDFKEEIISSSVQTKWLKDRFILRILYISLFIIIVTTIISRTKLWPFITLLVLISLLIMDRKILLQTDYVLLLTFLCFFIFSSSISHNPKIATFLSNSVRNHEYLWSILLSQLISNVPSSIVLWPFTDNLKALLYGLDSAGLCSIIGSLASVINLRIYSKEYPGKTKSFMKYFHLISLAFFIIVVFPQYLLINK